MDILGVKLHSAMEQPIDLNEILGGLPCEQQKKIRRFRRFPDQLRSLCGELLIQSYAVEHWKLPPNKLDRQTNHFGKPEFVHYPTHHYNISHSGAWVVAAFDRHPVGIDIEELNDVDLTLADRFFTSNEAELVHSQADLEQKQMFYTLWTLKESYVKAKGAGLSIPLDSFEFGITHQGEVTFSSTNEGNEEAWSFRSYAIDPDYSLAVCSRTEQIPESIDFITLDQLLADHSILRSKS
ncbi:4'-phosphopantetheinyl transferase family protein [Paenibacillus urinalis]|uniref:4'-phosphopantetheinyl transferase superfamily protein n=1 Tax=Paenibacillus urinalis TaxID=521520 RepID=A0AAX3MX69_9BACL|nr:4'-phosphopantetheinyl transferase superfamily protein [Paenibacillus urinalis]WDH81045.1 4'-phosphopantetheinyl transferase superfamily protein [Paenibacillus urinalis]